MFFLLNRSHNQYYLLRGLLVLSLPIYQLRHILVILEQCVQAYKFGWLAAYHKSIVSTNFIFVNTMLIYYIPINTSPLKAFYYFDKIFLLSSILNIYHLFFHTTWGLLFLSLWPPLIKPDILPHRLLSSTHNSLHYL